MDTFNQKNYSVTWIPKNLELNKNIFLSHSGCDKPFVEKLYTALLRKTYDAFFDKKSLPKAVVINMENILKEVGKSKLCVFVLSEAFFTETKNPMLEFMSFLDAHINDSSKRLLPLFYNLSVKEFKNEERHGKWMKKWEEWAQEGSMAFDINPERWKGALKNLSDTSGIEMTKGSKEEQYIEEIICEICKIIPPDSRYDEPCMHGEQRMGKVVDDLYLEHEKCAKHEPSKVCLLGMHGMGGLGKTTLSKFAWNYFWSEFEGRVFRVELDSGSKDSRFQRMRSVLEKLSNIPKEILASLNDVDEARKWYRRHIGERRVFLIIDNANSECMEEIRMYLQGVSFHQGSRVLILSRSKTNLQEIGMEMKDVYPNFHIVKMVSLRKEEAEGIFFSRAQVCREQLSRREYDIVRDSVELCLFEGFYHPMVVQALASRIKQDNWDAQFLSKYRTGALRKTVIKLLKESFDAMETQTKIILLDLALYLPSTDLKCDPYEWLSSVNEIEQSEVKNELAELRRRAFLSEEGLAVHELVKELAILASNDNTIKSCVYFDKTKQPWARLEDADAVHVERLGMDSCEAKIPTLNLQKCPWLRAVKIKDVTGLRKVQMRQNMVSLRSFEVSSSEFMEGFRGDWNRMSKKPCIRSIVIEGNRNFGSLNWVSTENCRLVKPIGRKELRSGQFGSLVCLRMLVGLEQISIPWQALQSTLNSLKELELGGFDGGGIIKLPEFRQLRNLHLTKCLSTRELHFVSLPMVENLRIHWAPNLTFIGGLERCSSSLKHLDLFGCTSLQSKFLDLSSLSLLSDLKIWYYKSLVRLKGLEKLQSLKSLTRTL